MDELKTEFADYLASFTAAVPRLALAIIVTMIVFFTIRLFGNRLIKLIRSRVEDGLLIKFIGGIIRSTNYILCFLLFLYLIGQAGIASSLLGAATLSSVVIGFAFKDIAENFLAGMILAFNRPFRTGDTIMTNGIEGTILGLNIRETHLKTFDGKDVYIPNGQIIKNPLYNYTIDGYLRGDFVVGVDYGCDFEKARKLILTAVSKVPGVLTEDRKPRTHVKNIGSSTIDIEVHYWIDTFDKNTSGLEVKSLAQTAAVATLLENNIALPTTIVEIKNYQS
jgi:small-conductance mechanosensitive channel